jgi:hypothetical protein
LGAELLHLSADVAVDKLITVEKMDSLNARASEPASEPAETQSKLTLSRYQMSNELVSAETPNVPCLPERPANRSLNRPLVLKRRKLRSGLPPTIVSRRSSGQTKHPQDLHNKETSAGKDRLGRRLRSISTARSNLYLLPKETVSTITSSIAPDDSGNEVARMREVASLSANLGNRPNLLQMRGDYWEICYENQSAIIDESRGLRYIALLIQHTAQSKGPLHATELVALAKGAGNVLVELPSKEIVIDAAAEKQITKRLEQIAFERNDASACNDYDRIAALDAEVEQIAAEFERLKGRGRKKASFNNDAEKARKAVSKAIADTVAKLLALPHMESLANHLTDTIRKGQWLSYNGNIDWQIDFSAAPFKNFRPLRRK